MRKNIVLEKTIKYTGDATDLDETERNTTILKLHEQSNYFIVTEPKYVVLKNKMETDTEKEDDEEIIKEISKFNYEAVLVPAL